MKKRVTIFAALIMTVILAFALTGCIFDGKSAYEIAVANGFVGTEQQWLESLKGRPGEDAPPVNIYDLFDAYKIKNPDATFADFLQTFLVIGYYDTEYAAAIGVQSMVSVYSTFTKQTTKPGQAAEYYSAGSGVVYRIDDNDAYIITNYHVIYDRESSTKDCIAKTIETYSYGFESTGRGVQATFIGGSMDKDVAVLKTSFSAFSGKITAAKAGDSNLTSLGEKVVAIGNPSAEGLSVSVGALSVDSEEIQMEALDSASKTVSMRVMRTDTAINRGNSGGGLFNSRGQLIGIVNAKTIASGVENIGYAIPINVAVGIADSVIENDSKKCVLGVTVTVFSTQTQYNSENNRVDIVDVITIDSITFGSLASGKLMQNDKLISVRINDGEPLALTRLFHLSDYLYKVRKGDTIFLEIERDDLVITVEMTPQSEHFNAI